MMTDFEISDGRIRFTRVERSEPLTTSNLTLRHPNFDQRPRALSSREFSVRLDDGKFVASHRFDERDPEVDEILASQYNKSRKNARISIEALRRARHRTLDSVTEKSAAHQLVMRADEMLLVSASEFTRQEVKEANPKMLQELALYGHPALEEVAAKQAFAESLRAAFLASLGLLAGALVAYLVGRGQWASSPVSDEPFSLTLREATVDVRPRTEIAVVGNNGEVLEVLDTIDYEVVEIPAFGVQCDPEDIGNPFATDPDCQRVFDARYGPRANPYTEPLRLYGPIVAILAMGFGLLGVWAQYFDGRSSLSASDRERLGLKSLSPIPTDRS
jgi:hypothetical protein